MRSRRRNRGSVKLAWRNRDRTGELVILVNDSWAYNKGLVPAIRFADYESFDGFDKRMPPIMWAGQKRIAIDRNGESIRTSIPNKSIGVFLGHVRVKIGRGPNNEHWGLTGGYRILIDEHEFVIPPGYVHFALDGKIRTICGEQIDV
jgi:hypothetical protein